MVGLSKNYSAIIGETKFEFNPKTSGQYALEIKSNSCIDTSECLTYIFVTSDQVIIEGDFQIVPNPNSGNFIVNIKDILYKDLHMEIKSIDGRLLFSEKLKTNQHRSILFCQKESILLRSIQMHMEYFLQK